MNQEEWEQSVKQAREYFRPYIVAELLQELRDTNITLLIECEELRTRLAAAESAIAILQSPGDHE